MPGTWQTGRQARQTARLCVGAPAATPGAQLMMLGGYDHNAPPEVLTPILIDFFGANR
ncbi:MAG TPA: hypothetical protein VFQ68_26025 [Streptosporangiaceae bacterium]|nr:hypothetical protein [Streptosporangiaceae bacterium]